MKLKVLYVFALMILILGVGMVSASDETVSTWDVESDENSTCSLVENDSTISKEPDQSEKTFEDIQDAIDESKDNDVIELNGTYLSHNKRIIIDKPLTINGNNAILDAQQNLYYGVLHIQNSNVILKNLKIINCQPTAIYAYGAKLTFVNCTFSAQMAETFGLMTHC